MCIPMQKGLQKQLTFMTYLLDIPYGKKKQKTKKQQQKKTTTKNIMNRTCPIACGKHKWNKFHVIFQFPRYAFSLRAVKTYVGNIPWKPGFKLLYHSQSEQKLQVQHQESLSCAM